MAFDMIREVRNTWQFFRDRRPETYNTLVGDFLITPLRVFAMNALAAGILARRSALPVDYRSMRPF
jgi:hypothetical protein